MRIDKLTPEQIARFPEWVDKWVKIGLSTEPADWEMAERGVRGCYKVAKLKQPKVILRIGSPFAVSFGGPLAVLMLGNKKVWSQVRSQVRSQVGAQAGSAWTQYRGAQLWASWYSWVTFLRDICGWKDKSLDAFAFDEMLALSCGWTWWHDDVCAISDRPKVLHRNAAGQLHSEIEEAIRYRDGWGFYCLNGVVVPDWLVKTPKQDIDPKRVSEIENVEVRREFVRKIGIERCIEALGWKPLDVVGDYTLGEVSVVGSPRRYLKMLNPSVHVWHLEAVHPDCQSVQEALNWRAYGDKSKNWNPIILT